MLEIIELSILSILILLNALWNGFAIQWYRTKDHKYSKWWHKIGFISRALIVMLIYFESGNYYYTGAAAFLCWLPYNIIINKCISVRLFYVGTTSTIDRFIREFLMILKLIKNHIFGKLFSKN